MEGRWSATTWVLLSLLVLTWGFNYLVVSVGLTVASPLWLATSRAGVGLVGTLLLVTALRGWGTLDARGRRDALVLGIPNTTLFFGLWFLAARAVPPGIASVVIYTFPLWVALFSSFGHGPPLGRLTWMAIGTGFFGVALVSQGWNLVGPGVSFVPILELLVAAISWAIGTVLFQRRFGAQQVLSANAYQLAGGLLGLFAATLALGVEPLPALTPTYLAASLWLGLAGTAVAYTIWFTLLSQSSPARVSAFLFLVPLVALVASIVLLEERLVWLQAAGVGLVLASIYGVARTRINPATSSGTTAGLPAGER